MCTVTFWPIQFLLKRVVVLKMKINLILLLIDFGATRLLKWHLTFRVGLIHIGPNQSLWTTTLAMDAFKLSLHPTKFDRL